jgi:hypothetical protein
MSGAAGVSAKFWKVVEDKLSGLPIQRPRIYVESYTEPSRSFEPGAFENPNDIADLTPEERVIGGLLKRVGGTIETTEKPSLLEKNVQIAQELGDAYHAIQDSNVDYGGEETTDMVERMMEALSPIIAIAGRMEEAAGNRNTFIAEKIATTLLDGETGILFLGKNHFEGDHNIISMLPEDIEVGILDESLREIAREVNADTKRELGGGSAEVK